MRSTIGKAFWVLSAVVMTLSLSARSAAAQDSESAASPLVGTWQVKVTLVNCQTGDPLGPPTLAEETTNPTNAPGQRSPGQGVWETNSHDVFHARSVAFINFTTPAVQAGQQFIDQIITYDDASDQWNAVAAIKFTDTNGAVYRQGCATATATRF